MSGRPTYSHGLLVTSLRWTLNLRLESTLPPETSTEMAVLSELRSGTQVSEPWICTGHM